MREHISREAAWAALRRYNQEPFHLQHALTVEGVMQWYAKELGYGGAAEFWGTCGLARRASTLIAGRRSAAKRHRSCCREAGCGEDIVHAVCGRGYGLCCDVAPEHEMEKVLFAADELTGLIGAAALMRPSRSCQDMELKSLKKKYKDKKVPPPGAPVTSSAKGRSVWAGNWICCWSGRWRPCAPVRGRWPAPWSSCEKMCGASAPHILR